LDRAHEESKQKVEAVIISVEQEKGKEFPQKCRSELNEFLDDAFKKIKTKNENIKVLNLRDVLKSFAITMLQTVHFLRQKQARNDMEQRKNNSFSSYKNEIDFVSVCVLFGGCS